MSPLSPPPVKTASGSVLREDFPPELAAVWTWLGRTRGMRRAAVGNWVWAKAPAGQFKEWAPVLAAAGFRRSTARPGWWYHAGRRWLAGEVVRVGGLGGRAVMPFGPRPPVLDPARGATLSAAEVAAREQAAGKRCEVVDDLRGLLLRVDWVGCGWGAAVLASEEVLAWCECHQGSEYRLRPWPGPCAPPVAADFTARPGGLDWVAVRVLALGRARELAEVRNRVRHRVRKREERVVLARAVIAAGSLREQARVELAAVLGQPAGTKGVPLAKAVRALLADPGLVLPAGIGTVAEVEARTGRTPGPLI